MKNINMTTISSDITLILTYGFLGFAIAMMITPIYTYLAYKYKWWKQVKDTAITGEKATVFHKLHAEKHKRHFPTMAGLIMIVGVTVVTLLFNLSREQTYLPLVAMLGAGLIGLFDDILNLRSFGKGIAGMRSKLKLFLITLVAALGGLYFYYKLGYSDIYIPFINGGMQLSLGVGLIFLFILVIVATANAVNLSDGLDGLAGGLLVYAYGAYAAIAFLRGDYGIAGFCMTVVGTLFTYVWFNIFPARFMMGDTGSFALGTALGVVAMLTDSLVLLPVIGIVFVVETGSVIVQLFWKKVFGHKLLLSSPIHHHFEALGWPETKVTMRFWVVGQVAAVLGVVLAIVGGHV